MFRRYQRWLQPRYLWVVWNRIMQQWNDNFFRCYLVPSQPKCIESWCFRNTDLGDQIWSHVVAVMFAAWMGTCSSRWKISASCRPRCKAIWSSSTRRALFVCSNSWCWVAFAVDEGVLIYAGGSNRRCQLGAGLCRLTSGLGKSLPCWTQLWICIPVKKVGSCQGYKGCLLIWPSHEGFAQLPLIWYLDFSLRRVCRGEAVLLSVHPEITGLTYVGIAILTLAPKPRLNFRWFFLSFMSTVHYITSLKSTC